MPEPTEELENLGKQYYRYIPDEQIDMVEKNWCGRYVLIVQGRIYLDAADLLGIFYSKEGISSSSQILADVMELPAPLTHYEQIRRLFPGQVYNYIEKNCIKENWLFRICRKVWMSLGELNILQNCSRSPCVIWHRRYTGQKDSDCPYRRL